MNARGTQAGILVQRRFASYKDKPGLLYHFPRRRYEKAIRELEGRIVLIYEPRRGGTSAESATGGRMAFVGMAFLGASYVDPEDPAHAYVELKGYLDFMKPVSLGETALSPKALEHAVQTVDLAIVDKVMALGITEPLRTAGGQAREGLVALEAPAVSEDRTVREVVSQRPVRDATFRYRVVEQAYGGRCALSGMRLVNGLGRAETDAAHIRPVEAGGPDSVRNGIALSKTVHWAFDRGLVSLSNDSEILTVERGLDDSLRRIVLPEGRALLPVSPHERPHPVFLAWHRENVFKGSRS